MNYLMILVCWMSVVTGCNSKRDEVTSILFQVEGDQVNLQGRVNAVKIAGKSGVVITLLDKEALKNTISKNINNFFDITVKGQTYYDVTFDEVIINGEFVVMEADETIVDSPKRNE